MRETQFNEYMSIYSIQQIRKVLMLQQDRDMLELDKAKKDTIQANMDNLNLLSQALKGITKTEDLIYKLSNPYMNMDENADMVLPVKEKWAKVLILVKTITALNRLYKHNNQDIPVITEMTLDALGYGMDIDSLEKVLNLLEDARITRTNEGLQVDFNSIWSSLPGRGSGYIKYDMSNYQKQIDIAYSYMEDVYSELNKKEAEELS